jgi:AcrR family transcriptional regulator
VTALTFDDVTFSVPEAGSTAERVIDATLRCVARWGVAKTTVDDVAREAGVGRATLYRMFPGGRDALFDGAVAAETARFFARLDGQLGDAASLEDTLVIAIVEAGRSLRDHPPLQFLLAHEPEAILPHVAFHQMDAVLRTIAELARPYLSPWLPDSEAAARGAEWVTRIVLSYAVAPSSDVDVCDAASVRSLVRTFILPGLQAG